MLRLADMSYMIDYMMRENLDLVRYIIVSFVIGIGVVFQCVN